ncbi:MAG TPA: hypothetical protein VNN17_01385 [Terriglobia bacterium]|nr:hypothetical protein [Terriglobia bacterium]
MTTLVPSLALLHPPAAAVRAMNRPLPETKLRKAAQDFEALLLSSCLGEMRKAFSGSFGTEDPARSSLEGLAISALANALAAAGGVGMARMIFEELRQNLPQPVSVQGLANSAGRPGENR